jgi:hypothetical protein
MELQPSSFARMPVRIDAHEEYCHASQTAAVCEMSAVTFRATQTYDHKGMPKDNDND